MRSQLVSAFVISSSLASCAADRQTCRTNAECGDAFGFGSVCVQDGYCRAPQVPARCARSVPDALLLSGSSANYHLIGTLFDRSTATHRARENAVRLAIEQVNTAGGFGDGTQLGAIACTIEQNPIYDNLSRTDAAVAMADYLASVGVTMVVGPSASADVAAVAQRSQGTLVIATPSATSSALASLDGTDHSDADPGWLWRLTPSDTQAAVAVAADMTRPGAGRTKAVQKLAIVAAADAYGQSLSDAVAAKLTIPIERFTYSAVAQLGEQVAQAAASDADEVMFISSQIGEIVAFFDAAANLPSFATKTIFLSDTAPNADVLNNANPALFSRVRGSRPLPLDRSSDLVFGSFVAAYAARFGEDPTTFSFVAQSYDATWMLGLAFAQATDNTPAAISLGMRHLSAGMPFDARGSHWGPTIAALRAKQSVDINGASGSLNFDPVSKELSGPVQIWGIDTTGAPKIVERDRWLP